MNNASDDRAGDDPVRRNYNEPKPVDPYSFPHKPRGGILPATIDNAEHLLDSYGIAAHYDVIRKKLLLTSSLPIWPPDGDNSDNTAMAHLISLAGLNAFPTAHVGTFVAAIGDAHPYNPVREWIESKDWDGIDRLPDLCATLTEAEDYPRRLKLIIVRKWLLSAVAAALRRRFRGRGVLTLQGPQGIGKTQWVASLMPPELRDQLLKLDHHLDAHQKDSILGAISHWIVELGELDSAMRRDVARLKGVLTRDSDKVRKPYAKAESEMPRRTVFAATVNHPRFLSDDTGNSRWWTISVTHINWKHDIDMQQVFAQLAVELEGGGEWWLSAEEEQLLGEYNRRHRTVSAIEEQVLDALELDTDELPELTPLTPRELLMLVGISQPTNPQCKECAGVLRDYFGESKRINGRDKWRIPLAAERRHEWRPAPRDKFD